MKMVMQLKENLLLKSQPRVQMHLAQEQNS